MEKKVKLNLLLDRTTFPKIFIWWILIILIFGLVFYLTGLSSPTLKSDSEVSFLNHIYFSFVTATTIGYGDIIPIGIGKLFAIIEGIVGLLIYGVVISKLVYFKQEVILEEIYNISFEERLNRLRSTLFLFRADVSKRIARIENKTINYIELRDLPITINTFNNSLIDIIRLTNQENKNTDFVRKLDDIHLELLLNSVGLSANKLIDLLHALKYSLKYSREFWKNQNTYKILNSVSNSLIKISEIYKDYHDEKIKDKMKEILEARNVIESYIR